MPLVDITVEQIFGDGLVWSGVVMMALLGQQKRSALPFQNINSCHDNDNQVWVLRLLLPHFPSSEDRRDGWELQGDPAEANGGQDQEVPGSQQSGWSIIQQF